MHHFCRREIKGYFHGFTHPRRALRNAEREFQLSGLERDMILRHMWPLTIIPPKYRESYVINASAFAKRYIGGRRYWPTPG